MTVLDQAFIKAYGGPDAAVTPIANTTEPPAPPRERSAVSQGNVPTACAIAPAERMRPEAPRGDAGPRAIVPETVDDSSRVSTTTGTVSLPGVAGRQPVDEPAAGEFCPMLQVDRFVWPAELTRFGEAAATAIDPLADDLVAGTMRGRRVVAMASCRRGEGCTTLLIALARRLADRDVKAIIIDADFDRPQIARRLGLRIDADWEDVLTGQVPLAEIVVQSVHDLMTLVPLAERPEGRRFCLSESPDPAATAELLCRHYQLVLVDLGCCGRPGILLGPPQAARPWIDRFVLVRDVRGTSPADVAQACRLAEAAGIDEIGVVENFVERP